MQDISVIIPAAGSGSRMGGVVPKPYMNLAGLPVLSYTLRCFDLPDQIAMIVLAISDDCHNLAQDAIRISGISVPVKIVQGGAERLDSIRNAMQHIPDQTRLVAIHDAVRPFVDNNLFMRLIEAASQFGACVPGLPVTDTVKQIDKDGFVVHTPDRSLLCSVQTPQIFHSELLVRAYQNAVEKGIRATDDASLVEIIGEGVKIIDGDPDNIKLTYPGDVHRARKILKNKQKKH